MKVGTDGVLLGAGVALGAADRLLLDVGTGTGVIALRPASRRSTSMRPARSRRGRTPTVRRGAGV